MELLSNYYIYIVMLYTVVSALKNELWHPFLYPRDFSPWRPLQKGLIARNKSDADLAKEVGSERRAGDVSDAGHR